MNINALVIEDNKEVAENLVRMLSLLDVRAKMAFSVREAILHLAEGIPDILFLDIKMPGYDGFEVMTYLRREPKLEKVPVCIVSSENQQETISKAMKLGAIDYVLKPATVEDLEGAIKKALASRVK